MDLETGSIRWRNRQITKVPYILHHLLSNIIYHKIVKYKNSLDFTSFLSNFIISCRRSPRTVKLSSCSKVFVMKKYPLYNKFKNKCLRFALKSKFLTYQLFFSSLTFLLEPGFLVEWSSLLWSDKEWEVLFNLRPKFHFALEASVSTNSHVYYDILYYLTIPRAYGHFEQLCVSAFRVLEYPILCHSSSIIG